ncbi:pseudouridine synthase [Nesterenkonia xinjiangensis]|uniref:Pseudouridine synthase n=1 Tax=Nesterenkonia xinjiangensis TaxID=225327 RepID=A0A7Z0K8J2_9MICC|nr:pseudouridine synthase [Nesterenkonia xinjiangensis]NYJ76728.1 pseudouridine synthase [Nesterenkonia xinjiangensis]
MTSSGKRPEAPREPRAVRAPRTPRAGESGGPFSDENPQRLISGRPRRDKPRLSEAEENFTAVHDPAGVRLQKVLAQAGVASRRVCEDLIAEGRVQLNGLVVVEPGVRVVPDRVTIHVDGVRLSLDVEHRYVMFNKPAGVVTTMDDPQGRRSIGDYLDPEMIAARLVHVGRLDRETEGLLLLTNDGELAHRLTHPSYEVPKTYLVEVSGRVPKSLSRTLLDGITLEDGPIAVDSCRQLGSAQGRSMVEVTLHSGRNRIVRRIFDHVGHPVTRLVRTAIGAITIGDQPQGSVRDLGKQELGHLLDLTSAAPDGTSAEGTTQGDDSTHRGGHR